jgi:transcriptional repressor NrdR
VVPTLEGVMRCPWCGHDDDRVVDSRLVEGGAGVRRRRECRSCHRRFTTFERIEDLGLFVIKRDGSKEPYDVDKVVDGIRKAIKNRPVTADQVTALAARVQERLRRRGPRVTSQEVGLEVLAQLRKLDHVAYIRFASVYKDFQKLTDFEKEVGLLLQKREAAAKRPAR